jgi:hypothetical protein
MLTSVAHYGPAGNIFSCPVGSGFTECLKRDVMKNGEIGPIIRHPQFPDLNALRRNLLVKTGLSNMGCAGLSARASSGFSRYVVGMI